MSPRILRKIAAEVSLLTLGALAGCAPAMITNFEVAQRLAAQQNKGLFIFFESWESTDCGEMKSLIQSPAIQRKLNGKIVCDLDELWEPNQRFVAQYGVSRHPAVIIVHPDGSYHRQVGKLGERELSAFIENARPPGDQPAVNPQIPRRIDYQWAGDLPRALATAEQQGRRLFLFYKSVISADSNEMLFNVLNRPEVAVHFDDTVNCLLDWAHAPNRGYMTRFGITNVPAVVFIRRDGTYHAHQGRLSSAQLISFVRQARNRSGKPLPALETTP